MQTEQKDLGKGQIEITVTIPFDDFKKYFDRGAEEVAREIKVDGFRPGKAPFDLVKQKVGEAAILEKSARLAINKTIGEALKGLKETPVGQPEINITKLAWDNPLEYKIVVALLPKITIGEYKNLGVKEEKTKVEDKDVEKTIEELRAMRAKEVLVSREISDNDKVLLSIEMFMDKVPLEGGQSREAAVVIGQKYIVPGFDEKIMGAKKGESREFSLPYPNDFHQKNLAGKMVDFKVKIKEVYERQVADVNDEFAKNLGMKNLEDLKKNIKENIIEEQSQKKREKTEIEIIEKLIKNSKFGDIPEVLINREVEAMMGELEKNVMSQGGKFEDYLASIKKSRGDLMLEFAPGAVKRIKSALIIREIAEKEGIKASEKEAEAEQKKLLEQYKGYEKVEEYLKSPGYRDYLLNILTSRKVSEKLREWNVKEE